MKIYISGMISGLNYDQTKNVFNEAQAFLSSLGFESINPFENGLNESHSWEHHMVRDIELLLECDAIYMLNGWESSKGARIEHYIAAELGKTILNPEEIKKFKHQI